MTKLSRLDTMRLVALSLTLIVSAAAGPQPPPPLAAQVAKTYGIESFEKVEAIRYTFTIPGLVPPRTWEWHPRTDTVTYAPLGKTSAQRLVAKYEPRGYSPGDTWELYIGPDKRVVEMTYHRAVPVPKWPNVIHATWEGYKKAGPLLFSTDHRLFSTDQHGAGDSIDFDLTFTGVAVKLKGSKDWIDAK